MEALIVGVGGCLVFGVGMCFGLGVFGPVTWPSVIFGLIGTVGMIFAYPVNRKCYNKMKDQHLPRILELTAELTGNFKSDNYPAGATLPLFPISENTKE